MADLLTSQYPRVENRSKIELLASLPESERAELLKSLTETDCEDILYSWDWHARPKQRIPGSPGAAIKRDDWLFWLVQAGRGSGKTRLGAETVRTWAKDPNERILLIAPTIEDVQGVQIDGPSGLMSCYPPNRRPVYNASRHIITFPSGAIGITRPASEPERLRGPQFTKFWWDESCACRYEKQVYDQIMFGFRLPSDNLRGLITTTPKPSETIKKIRANPKTVISKFSSDENALNLSPDYISSVIDPYRGTRLGRQEIDAELLEDVPGALWLRGLIDATRITLQQVRWDLLVRIVVAVDPAVSHNANSDLTGIIVAGLTVSGHVVVLDDLSCKVSALNWAKMAVAAYRSRGADRIVAEKNNGGDLVESNIRVVDANVSYRGVWASRGKYIRAEPVAALYERGMVHHVDNLGMLEDELCGWTPQSDAPSPNRLDALVWAITDLVIDPELVEHRIQVHQPYQIRG